MIAPLTAPSTQLVNVTFVNNLNIQGIMHTFTPSSTTSAFLQVLGTLGGVYAAVEGLYTLVFGRSIIAIMTGKSRRFIAHISESSFVYIFSRFPSHFTFWDGLDIHSITLAPSNTQPISPLARRLRTGRFGFLCEGCGHRCWICR